MSTKRQSSGDAEYKQILTKLIRARQAIGMSQYDLAQKLGWPISLVKALESCERRMDPVEFHHISEAIGQDGPSLFEDLTLEINPPKES